MKVLSETVTVAVAGSYSKNYGLRLPRIIEKKNNKKNFSREKKYFFSEEIKRKFSRKFISLGITMKNKLSLLYLRKFNCSKIVKEESF